jgi:hypothetical protein
MGNSHKNLLVWNQLLNWNQTLIKYRTQFWKGAIQGSFHQSLVAIGPVVSEEKVFM